MEVFWITHTNVMGNNDRYGITSEESARKVIEKLVRDGFHYCEDAVVELLEKAIAEGQLPEAVEFYNRMNMAKEHIAVRVINEPEGYGDDPKVHLDDSSEAVPSVDAE